MVVAILAGATGVGKSAVALELAARNGFEIIAADSRQIYRGFAVGTGAPSPAEAARVPHHLVGILDPAEACSPRDWPARVQALLAERPEARFLVVGGTGLYLKELLYPSPRDRGPTPEAVRAEAKERLAREGTAAVHAFLLREDPESVRGVHPNDAYRLAKRLENRLLTGEGYAAFAAPAAPDPRLAGTPFLWLDDDREALYARIEARVRAMADAGWLDEVKAVLASRADWRDLPAMSSLGYAEMAQVAQGLMPLEDALHAVQKKTRNYAKRQRTFFRHQFPGALRWEPAALRAALEAAAWDWEAFRSRHLPAGPGNGDSAPPGPAEPA